MVAPDHAIRTCARSALLQQERHMTNGHASRRGMTSTAGLGAIAAFLMLTAAGCSGGERGASAKDAQRAPGSFDVMIRNGHIIDGAGGPWYAADIGIRGDRIIAIGDLKGATATKVIDASRRV